MARNDSQIIINVLDASGEILNEITTEDIIIRNPYNVNIDRIFMPNTEPLTLEGFFKIAKLLIQDAQEREGTNKEDQVGLVEEYPPENIDNFGTLVFW